MSGYTFDLSSRGYDPMEVRLALREWARYAEGLKNQLGASQAELELARSKNQSIRQEVFAEFSATVGRVVEAARREASAIVGAARQEASRIATLAEHEGARRVAEANGVAMRVRTEAEQLQRAGDVTLQEIQTTAEGLGWRQLGSREPSARARRGRRRGPAAFRSYEPSAALAPTDRSNGNGAPPLPKIEGFDPRWIDQL